MTGRRPEPPGGEPPPTKATIGDATLDLEALAREICRRYRDEFPDEEGRYGEAGNAWCVHDNQHILNWAAGSVNGFVDLERELTWLARILEARDFPLERLARNLQLAAEVVTERKPRQGKLQEALRAGGRFVAARQTFLD